MKNKLAILGAGGHGKVVADIAQKLEWSEIIFFDDNYDLSTNSTWFLAGGSSELISALHDYDGVIVAVGNNNIRWEKHLQLKRLGAKLVSIISGDAVVSRYCQIGLGTVVMPGSIINIESCIGEASIVNTATTIDHECSIGYATHLSPGSNLSGNVRIGNFTWIGTGASIKNNVSIGSNAIVGTGSVVVADVLDNQIVMGNPARTRVMHD